MSGSGGDAEGGRGVPVPSETEVGSRQEEDPRGEPGADGEEPSAASGQAAGPASEPTADKPQSESEGEPRGTATATTTVADDASVGEIRNAANYWENVYFGSGGEPFPRSRDLAAQDFDDVLDRDRLREFGAACFVSPDDLDAVVTCLRRYRLAFVIGGGGLGNGELCQVAASRIAAEDPSVREAAIVAVVDRGLRLRPEHLLECDETSGRLLLFEDAFHGGNQDLVRLAEQVDGPRIQGLRRRMEARGSYLLLTSDEQRFPDSVERVAELGALVRIEPPKAEVLLSILHRYADRGRYEGGRYEPFSAVARELVVERGEWLSVRLGTVPRVRKWVEVFLEQVAGEHLTLEQSLERLEPTERWLLGELPEDLSAWSFVLALALTSCHPIARWVPWLSFHRLWREVEYVVGRETGRDEPAPEPVRRLVVDAQFLALVKAEIRRLPYPSGDGVRFREAATAEQVWRVLLGAGRALLATLLPRLREVARTQDRVAVLASRALGRLGELEPAGVTQAEIDEGLGRTGAAGRYADAVLVGELVLGAQGSEDPDYRAGTLERLRAATGDSSVERAGAAIVAYVPLAAATPNRVLDLLWSVLRSRVGEETDAAVPLGRIVRERLDKLASTKKPPRKGGPIELTPGEAEGATLEALGDRAGRLLDAFQFALVGLCFGGEVVPVATAMAGWLRSGEKVAPWVGFLALRNRGVLRIMERSPLNATKAEEQDAGDQDRCSRILLAADDGDRVAAVVDLLESAHAAVGSFPGTLRTWLRSNLVRVIDSWMKQAARVAAVRERTVDILSRLLDATDETLRREVFSLIQSRSTGESTALRNLAREVFQAGMPGAATHTDGVTARNAALS